MTTRIHRMPFGAEIQPDGQVQFQIYAPGVKNVSVQILSSTNNTTVRLHPTVDGIYRIKTDIPTAGDKYSFLIDQKYTVPDPASRFQPLDVHGPSQIIDPQCWQWTDGAWLGRPWEETVLYEIHTGTFTQRGSFTAIKDRLDYLKTLGITAIELMPIADFPGKWNWGYDGVYMFAPDAQYGTPDELKDLVQSAHARGIMVFLDVVYNHFGPEGNYLHHYAADFFDQHNHTPWGAGINFDNPSVRQFFIHNALYWLNEFHLDGLRLDAVHAIKDTCNPDFLNELVHHIRRVSNPKRFIHLILENDDNQSDYLQDAGVMRYTAQWNDDLHHALHVVLTGETGSYLQDYEQQPVHHVARSLTDGFSYQGEFSRFRDRPRGQPSSHIPLHSFVSFLQNHDQVGNRAKGERLIELTDVDAYRAAVAIYLLAPSPPMLFMGEEWGSSQAFLFFCDLSKPFADKSNKGRLRELKKYLNFNHARKIRHHDVLAPTTFLSSKLNWQEANESKKKEWLKTYQNLISIRQSRIVPIIGSILPNACRYSVEFDTVMIIDWSTSTNSTLRLVANLSPQDKPFDLPKAASLIYKTPNLLKHSASLPPWSVLWTFECDSAGESQPI